MIAMNILPSSDAHFFDYNQTAPIDKRYPSPSNINYPIYYTASGNNLVQNPNSIFVYTNLSGQFSNYAQFTQNINNFQSFNEYIHYYPKNIDDLDDIDNKNMQQNRALKIPYLSSYKVNIYTFNPYPQLF